MHVEYVLATQPEEYRNLFTKIGQDDKVYSRP